MSIDYATYTIYECAESADHVVQVVSAISRVGEMHYPDDDALQHAHDLICSISRSNAAAIGSYALSTAPKIGTAPWQCTVDLSEFFHLYQADLFGRALFCIAARYYPDFTADVSESFPASGDTGSVASRRAKPVHEAAAAYLGTVKKALQQACAAFVRKPCSPDWTGLSGSAHVYLGTLTPRHHKLKPGKPLFMDEGGHACNGPTALWQHALGPEMLRFVLYWAKWELVAQLKKSVASCCCGKYTVSLSPDTPVPQYPHASHWDNNAVSLAARVVRSDVFGGQQTVLEISLGCIGPRPGQATVHFECYGIESAAAVSHK